VTSRRDSKPHIASLRKKIIYGLIKLKRGEEAASGVFVAARRIDRAARRVP
jgi:hypothetical protein